MGSRSLQLQDNRGDQRKLWWSERALRTILLVSLIVGALLVENPGVMVRATILYFLLLFVIRAAGRRTLGETTTFDFALLLLVSGACEQALMGDDKSLESASLVVVTLVTWDILFGWLKIRYPRAEFLIEGVPTILILDGKIFNERLARARIDKEDILEAARRSHGIGSLEEIRHAILEKNGDISIIPH